MSSTGDKNGNAVKFSQAISRVNVRLKPNVSEASSVAVIRVDVRNDQNSPRLISVIALENVTAFIRREIQSHVQEWRYKKK
jgi:predicted metal-dependent hydrolase